MIACLVHPDPTNQRIQLLHGFLEKLGYEILHPAALEAAAAEPALQKGGDNVVLVPVTPDWRPTASGVIELAQKVQGQAFVIYICDEIGPEDYKALLRTGA